MKTTKRLFLLAIVVLLMSQPSIYAQKTELAPPAYVVVTTLHWNMDNEDFDMDSWKKIEKEFLEKVTKKNEYVINSGFYMHRYTADNTELIFVRTFASWEDIDKATDRNVELAEAAWPNQKDRDAFFDKQQAYYDFEHSDEIYAPFSAGMKPFTAPPSEDMITYSRVSHWAFPEDGTQKEFMELYKELNAATIQKMSSVKAYYPNVHAWGSDRTEFLEVFYVDSMEALDGLFTESGKLVESHWPDENKRKEFFKKFDRYFTGVHGDYIYTYMPELSK